MTFKDNNSIGFNGDCSGGEFHDTPGIAKLADGEKGMRRKIRYNMHGAGSRREIGDVDLSFVR